MTYIIVQPKNEDAESRMAEAGDAVSDLLSAAVRDILQVPENDIIVELNRCTTISFNRPAVNAKIVPDVVLAFATSDRELQPRFQTLCDRVLSDWDGQFRDLKIEVWFTLIETWGTNVDNL